MRKYISPDRIKGVFGLTNPADLPGVQGSKPLVERYGFPKIRDTKGRKTYVSGYIEPIDPYQKQPETKVILVDKPVIGPGRVADLRTTVEAAITMTRASRELAIESRAVPLLATKVRAQGAALEKRLKNVQTEHHLEVRLTTLDDGAVKVETGLVGCSPECPCKRRNFNRR